MSNNNKTHKTKQTKPTVWVLRVYLTDESGSDTNGGCFVFKDKPTVEVIFDSCFRETCEELEADKDDDGEIDYKAEYRLIAQKLIDNNSYQDIISEEEYTLDEIELN